MLRSTFGSSLPRFLSIEFSPSMHDLLDDPKSKEIVPVMGPRRSASCIVDCQNQQMLEVVTNPMVGSARGNVGEIASD
jgi:hypothetical protein